MNKTPAANPVFTRQGQITQPMKLKSERTIGYTLKGLREIVENSEDIFEQKIAYAMEHAIRWATLETVGWPSMENEAKEMAKILRNDAAEHFLRLLNTK